MNDADFNNGDQPELLPDQEPEEEGLGTVLTILAFCIPLAGAIMYFTNRNSAPKKAKTACYAALAGMALGIIIRVITMAATNQ